MGPSDEVILTLKLLLHLGPPAVYFVILGLVNSQAVPRIINARTDFLTLTFVFCPVLFWPVPSLVRSGMGWLVFVGGLAVLAGFVFMLRRIDGGWVIYNISTHRVRRLLQRAARELGWDCAWEGETLRVAEGDLELTLSSLPVLRNVTVSFAADTDARRRAGGMLQERFANLLTTQQLLPSLSGSCLLMLGIGLLMLPLWMMSRHSNAIAEVLNHWLVS